MKEKTTYSFFCSVSRQLLTGLLIAGLSSCSYNPFSVRNDTTGSATGTAVGAAAGAGGVALLGGSKPLILAAGLGGGAIGYYVTTLRYDSGGIIQGGGQVYTLGDMIGIYIPTDNMFEPNTAEFTPRAKPILDSVVTVLNRKPNNNIIISGNTSGFSRPRWERRLSEERAKKVAAYLWNSDITQYKVNSNETRKLVYTGYGDYFPIAQTYTNDGIRANSRIQIISYQDDCELRLKPRSTAVFKNMGALNDSSNAVISCDKDDVNNGYKKEDKTDTCYKDE